MGPRYSAAYKQLMESGAPGLRISYATYNSVKLQTQRAAFLLKEWLCNNLDASAYDGGIKLASPWTMWWSSDGTTGPTAANDNTDRITDETKFATRANSDTSAISYYVLRSGTRLRSLWAPSTVYAVGDVVTDGVSLFVCQTAGISAGAGGPTGTTQGSYLADGGVGWRYIGDGDGYLYLCVAYRTAQDYFLSITFSTKYELAATPTFFPVAAANAAICLPANTHQMWLAGSDASGDRILHVSAFDDGTGFWLAAARTADVPTNGGCVVLGRIPDEYADGIDGTSVLALPAFLWTASASALKSNFSGESRTLYGYNTSYAVGGILVHQRSHVATQSLQANVLDCTLMAPLGFGTAAVVPLYSNDGFSTRRKWPIGFRYQSWPLTHLASTANSFVSAIIWGTVLDMHMGTPRGIETGLLFGVRWWCFGMLLIPNPSELEPTAT